MPRAELEALLGGSTGTPLPEDLRQRLAHRLGDLDDVRVHTGPEADAAAHYLHADAFAVHRDIYFAHGAYDPTSIPGQRLIAHEAAHVAQHRGTEAGPEIPVSSPGDAHEQAADAFADDFIAAGPRNPATEARVIRHDDERAAVVRPVAFAGISRSGATSLRVPPAPPSRRSLNQIDVDPVTLFPLDSYRKDWTLHDRTIPFARGVVPVGGVPVSYKADAGISATSHLLASYGPGMVDRIKVQLSETERGLIAAAPSRPVVSIGPLGPFGPSIGVGPSPESMIRDRILATDHSAEATARVSTVASARADLKVSASGGVTALDIFGGGVTAGITGSIGAGANATATATVHATYRDGKVTVSHLMFKNELELLWNVQLAAYAGIYVELRMPEIPVISQLTHEVQDWPVIGWIVPDLTKLSWRKDFTRRWNILQNATKRKWVKEWQVIADGTSPKASHPMSMGDDGYDFAALVRELTEEQKPDQDIPAQDPGPDAKLRDGAAAGAIASTRQAAKAQVKSARANIKRERAWNKQEIAKAVVRIKKTVAKTRSAPSLAITGGGNPTDEEKFKAALADRDRKLEDADRGAQNVDKKIDEVKVAAETRPEGPVRNQAREGYEALGKNADILGQAVGGYGAKADDFKRPEAPPAAGAPDMRDAGAARVEARRVLDEVGEKIDTELIRVDKQWHEAIKVPSLAAFAAKLDSYRAEIRNQCRAPLDKLDQAWARVPSKHLDDPDAQAHEFRELIRDARQCAAKLDQIKAKAPAVPMDEVTRAHTEAVRTVGEVVTLVNSGLTWATTELREIAELLKSAPTDKRGVLGAHKAKVEEYQRHLMAFEPSVTELQSELRQAETLLDSVELRELVLDDLRRLRDNALAEKPKLEIERPIRPVDKVDDTDEARMRFQVQWNTEHGGPTFSEKRAAGASKGVTVAEAVDALEKVVEQVTPEAARHAAAPARDRQIAFVRAQPGNGGLTATGHSWSQYFDYPGRKKGRVDIENQDGHNLRE